MEELEKRIKQINWDDDKSIKNFIENNNSDIFTGKNESGQDVVFQILKNESIKISTCQDNGWIRVNTYTIDNEDDSIIREETYEK